MVVVPFVNSPEGQELPFIANRLHSVKVKKVRQRTLCPSQALLAAAIADSPRGKGSLGALRRSMAVRYGAEVTCPVTTPKIVARHCGGGCHGVGGGEPYPHAVLAGC
jgi:hypothetical protein